MVQSWSVVITTRNRADMLRRAIESCLRQTRSCEVVIVDEASTDHTPEVVRSFPSVRYIRNEKPVGHCAAANTGIRAAAGSWIKPLDDDDWLADDCIEQMDQAVAAAAREGLNPVVVTGRAVNVDEKGRKLARTASLYPTLVAMRSTDVLRMMLDDRAPLGTPIRVGHSREAALAAGGWTPKKDFSYQFGEELGLWIALAASGDVVYLPETVGFRTMWPGGASARTPPEIRFRDNLHLKTLIADRLGKTITSSTRSYLALHWAMVAMRDGNRGTAAKLLLIWLRRPDSILKLVQRSRRPSRGVIRLADFPARQALLRDGLSILTR